MKHQAIPVVKLQLNENTQQHSKSILENEIKNIHTEHFALSDENGKTDYAEEGCKSIYLFVKGTGTVTAEGLNYEVVPETILVPNVAKSVTIKPAKNDTLHYLKITCELTEQDHLDMKDFPAENTQKVYFEKFSDCQAYTEPIKSPNTISRTIMPDRKSVV